MSDPFSKSLVDEVREAHLEPARAESTRRRGVLAIHREALRFPRDGGFDRRDPVPPRRGR